MLATLHGGLTWKASNARSRRWRRRFCRDSKLLYDNGSRLASVGT